MSGFISLPVLCNQCGLKKSDWFLTLCNIECDWLIFTVAITMGGVIQRAEEFDLWKVPEINLNEQTGMDISFVFYF